MLTNIHKGTYWHTVCSIWYTQRIMWVGKHLVMGHLPVMYPLPPLLCYFIVPGY